MKCFKSPKNVVVVKKANGKEYAERSRKPRRYNPYKDKYLALYSEINDLRYTRAY